MTDVTDNYAPAATAGWLRRDWMQVGHALFGSTVLDEGHPLTRQTATDAADAMVWHPTPDGVADGPAMPVLAIQALADQLRLPRVSAIAWSAELAPYALIAAEANYRDVRVRIHALDLGSETLPLWVDVYEPEP